jgi:NAD(P) transhydrogenase
VTAAGYDLIAIGSGPAGQRAALEAAKLSKRVAIVERVEGPRSGEIPSKTLQATIAKLTSVARRDPVAIDDLTWRTEQVLEQEQEAIADRLRRSGVEVFAGSARFVDPHTLEIAAGQRSSRASAERFVIAVGTTPARPPGADFDDRTVLDPGGFQRLPAIPATLTIVGAGMIGLQYASMAAALGCRVTLVDRRTQVLEPVDAQIVEALVYHLRGLGVAVRLGEEVVAIEPDTGIGAVALLRGGERIASDAVIHTGRRGATPGLGLAAAGLAADDHGRIVAGPAHRTAQPHIFAAGDVTGFPALAAASAEQGRVAALAAFGIPAHSIRAPLPYAIHTIPEIAFAGAGERELEAAGEPYVRGVARYRELSRGTIEGDRCGLLKLLVHARTRRVEGVHVFGTSATELIHIGQTAMAGGLTVDYLAGAVFSVPTFADAYRIAALDAAGRLDETDARLGRLPPLTRA